MIFESLLQILNIQVLALLGFGCISGLLIGALPGISVTMATAILVSITVAWPIEHAMAMIIGVYCSGVFAGSIAAILLNIPGTPAAIVSGFDGYPLAKMGEATEAMSLARIGSFIGGMIGVLCLAVFAPLIAKVALSFSPFEYVALVMLGLITVSNLGKGSFANAMLSALLGFVISSVGIDPIDGTGRFTFGSTHLASGIGLIPCLVGVFGMSEVLFQLNQSGKFTAEVTGKIIKKKLSQFSLFVKMIPLILRSSLIGTWIGALPGEGGAIAALLSYDSAKRSVKNPSRPFGEGAYEGVVAPEVSNNAAIGGALITLLTLGVPGDAVTAVMMGAFMIHGLRPGPLLMESSADLFWMIVFLLVFANIIFLFVGLLATRYVPRLLQMIRSETLMPIVCVFCVVGSYSLESSMFDVFLMLGFGVLGYIFKISNFPIGPLVIGMVLGPIGDNELRKAIMLSDGNFFGSFVSHPIAMVLVAICVLQVLLSNARIKAMKTSMIEKITKSVKRK